MGGFEDKAAYSSLVKRFMRCNRVDEARAMAKSIRTLQAILHIPHSSDEELAGRSLEDLQATIDSLQQQISSRMK
jgi:hypothetical protein